MSEATLEPVAAGEQSQQAVLLAARNKALYARFLELYDGKRLRRDDVIKLLTDEFFITGRTIAGVIKQAAFDAEPATKKPTKRRRSSRAN